SPRHQRPVSAVTDAAPRAPSVDRDGLPASARSGGRGPVVPPSRASQSRARYTQEFVDSLRARIQAQDLQILQMNGNNQSGTAQTEERAPNDEAPTKRAKHSEQRDAAARTGRREETHSNPHPSLVYPPMQFSTFVHEAMQQEFPGRYAEHLPMSEGMHWWVGTLIDADRALPKVKFGLEDKVDKAQQFLLHEVPDAEMSYWPDEGLVVRSMAHAMEFTSKEDLSRVHLVFERDRARSKCFNTHMQKLRSDIWADARAQFRVRNGLPYTKPVTSRVVPPATPDPTVVEPITDEQFPRKYASSATTHDLMPWHCHEDTPEIPFSKEYFDLGIYATFKNGAAPPLVLKLYQVAFWLFG
ncbi:unnamed protein product, partial [Closterium sp. Naga37s-1]